MTSKGTQRTANNKTRVAQRARNQKTLATSDQATQGNHALAHTFDQNQRHSLPFPGLRSRHATAIILGFDSCRNMVVSRAIRLSKLSRAYILSQEYLPGFLEKQHDTLSSWLLDFKLSERFRMSFYLQISAAKAEEIVTDTDKLEDIQDQLAHLKAHHPLVYIALGSSKEGFENSLAKITNRSFMEEYFSWYVHLMLPSKISELRAGLSKQKQKKTIQLHESHSVV